MQSIESKAKGKDHVQRNLHEKIKELEGQIELKTALQNQSEKQISQLSDKLKGKDETCSTLQQKVAFYLRFLFFDSNGLLIVVWPWFVSSKIRKKQQMTVNVGIYE